MSYFVGLENTRGSINPISRSQAYDTRFKAQELFLYLSFQSQLFPSAVRCSLAPLLGSTLYNRARHLGSDSSSKFFNSLAFLHAARIHLLGRFFDPGFRIDEQINGPREVGAETFSCLLRGEVFDEGDDCAQQIISFKPSWSRGKVERYMGVREEGEYVTREEKAYRYKPQPQ